MDETEVDDHVIGFISRLGRLRWLSIERTRISDKGVLEIKARRPDLTIVWIAESDRNIIDQLRSLEPFWETNTDGRVIELAVASEQITEEIISIIAGLNALEKLRLSGSTCVLHGSIQQFSKLQRLNELSLVNFRLTEMAVEHISRLSTIKILDIRGSHMNDDVVYKLERLVGLERLDIRDTGMGMDAIKRLSSALPLCKIDAVPPIL